MGEQKFTKHLAKSLEIGSKIGWLKFNFGHNEHIMTPLLAIMCTNMIWKPAPESKNSELKKKIINFASAWKRCMYIHMLKVPGPISQNGDIYLNDASLPKKSWF